MAITKHERNHLPEVKAKRLVNKAKWVNTRRGRLKTLIGNARSNAKRLGRTCSITYEDLVELYNKQEGKCVLTGWEMTPIAGQFTTISVDRIDSSQGYIKGNIQLVA